VELGSYSHKRPLSYLLKRALWAFFQLPFLRGTPKQLSFLRVGLLKLFGARIAGGCLICGGVRVWEPWNLEMGAHSVVGTGAEIYNLAKITIGANAVISQDAYLCSASHDYTDKAFPLFSKPISIGSGAWVASKAFIGPGVSIGEGTVIGACSVVTKDMPAWMVCAGNPCKPIKPRLMQNTNGQN
jgi:putative colanic acid biosynthesis acetyltransferase WcaF